MSFEAVAFEEELNLSADFDATISESKSTKKPKSKQTKSTKKPEPSVSNSNKTQVAKPSKAKRSKSAEKTVVEEPEVPAAPSQQKPKKENRFSANVLISFFNTYFRNLDPSFESKYFKYQKITFKQFTEKHESKKNSNVINLQDYEGLKLFVDGYRNLKAEKADADMSDIIAATFDPKLRAFLSVIETFQLSKHPDVFKDYVMPHLQFEPTREVTIKMFNDALREFFNNSDKIKTKLFNKVFPHGAHENSTSEQGVNTIYLQHIAKFHDLILKLVIDEQKPDADILKTVQHEYAKTYVCSKKELPEDELMKLKIQLVNPEILKFVQNPEFINKPSKKQIINYKWISSLKPYAPKNKPRSEPLTQSEVFAIKELVRELIITVSFLKILRLGFDSNADKNPQECYAKYKELVAKTEAFKDAHLDVADTYQGFLKFLVDSVRFIKNNFDYKYPLKSLTADSQFKVQLRFPKKLRTELEKLFNADSEPTDAVIAKLCSENRIDWETVNAPKSYNFGECDIYAKIGKYPKLELTKEYRVGVGAAIVSYIQDELRLLRALNRKKKDLIVYIKF